MNGVEKMEKTQTSQISQTSYDTLRKGIFRKKALKIPNQTDHLISFLFFLAIAITVYTVLFRIEYKWDSFRLDIANQILSNLLRFDLVANSLKIEMAFSLVNTLALSFLATLLGFVVGMVFGLLGARNISNPHLASAISAVSSVIRAVPTIVWVLIFVSGYGLSSTTAVVGMFFHTLAFFNKSFAESFEEIDQDTIDALKATGANWFQVVFGAVIPSSASKIIAWFAIRYEINFAVAVIIGPAVGVSGTIGTLINNAQRQGDFSAQGFGVILLFALAFLMETLINKVRQKNIVN